MQIKKALIILTILFSANIFSSETREQEEDKVTLKEGTKPVSLIEFTGKISIAPRYLFRTMCHKEDSGLFEVNSIFKHTGVQYSQTEQAYSSYPKPYLGRRCCSSYEYSDDYENENRIAQEHEYDYHVMPQYITNIIKAPKLFIFVKIVLNDGKNMFLENTFCYLPLNVFRNEDNSYKEVNDTIELIMHFKDYDNVIKDCIFRLKLDYTCKNIKVMSKEFLEESKSCGIRTKNCLNKAIKRLSSLFCKQDGDWEHVD
ncbi:MAG: hypothetical protein P4L22_01290 [Candidatus Babeliales bacterium]|nr:hypothetical protein [Candidatus Babeliales bacterium]